MVQLEDGNDVPLFSAIIPRPVEHEQHDFTQTWSWAEAEQSAARAVARVTVAQVMGHVHPATDRMKAMETVVRALVTAGDCVATYWPGSDKWVPPDQVSDGFVNVRLFNVEGSAEMFMDSLGLHTLDLPDLECRFAEGDPGEVASALYGLAEHLIAHGDVIGDGDTIGGDAHSARRRATRAESSVDPDRVVLALGPAS